MYDKDYYDYEVVKDVIRLKKGRYPNKEYEVLVHYDYRNVDQPVSMILYKQKPIYLVRLGRFLDLNTQETAAWVYNMKHEYMGYNL